MQPLIKMFGSASMKGNSKFRVFMTKAVGDRYNSKTKPASPDVLQYFIEVRDDPEVTFCTIQSEAAKAGTMSIRIQPSYTKYWRILIRTAQSKMRSTPSTLENCQTLGKSTTNRSLTSKLSSKKPSDHTPVSFTRFPVIHGQRTSRSESMLFRLVGRWGLAQ